MQMIRNAGFASATEGSVAGIWERVESLEHLEENSLDAVKSPSWMCCKMSVQTSKMRLEHCFF
jgi:hypothetical protein